MRSDHSSDTVGQLVLVDANPLRQQTKKAIAGFLAGYSGETLEGYQTDLRQWIEWIDTAAASNSSVDPSAAWNVSSEPQRTQAPSERNRADATSAIEPGTIKPGSRASRRMIAS